jgi:hypothetical protein
MDLLLTSTVAVGLQPSIVEDLKRIETRFRMSDGYAKALDHDYRRIQAPSGVAPPSRQPFQVTSELNSHDWINFTKVYGKYLLSNVYQGQELELICAMLDLSNCFLSMAIGGPVWQKTATDLIAKIKQELQQVPKTELALVVHMMVYHMYDTLWYWGPARGFWCFPPERSVWKRGTGAYTM